MAPRLNRKLEVLSVTAGTVGANGGLTGDVASFKLLSEGAGPSAIDVYLVALDSAGMATAATGTWQSGSTITSTVLINFGTVRANFTFTLERPVVWNASTTSLRYGAAHRNGRNSQADTVTPPISAPSWAQLALYATAGTISGKTVTGGMVANVSGVRATTQGSTFGAWGQLLEQYTSQQDVQEGNVTVTQITGLSTWRLRYDPRIRAFSTLTDGDVVWSVVGTRRLLDRGRMMEVECQRVFQR